ncbi:glycosyltransferase family 2 protein [Pseudarthrobacter sp. NamB4]|uniref:glycosyltransferase family 2 protein n=1 Tax=Pseudarthrobacter sp. NamB4 TaxID=2576837 RepID=UPI0010FDB7E6|nr:glycosyltransferase family 2 protein [Pseudarthrobacter sp. NamB4]TLM74488.1 glycosyltransferase family 2 protein [Pseudarthrobacter sp. NamB4]
MREEPLSPVTVIVPHYGDPGPAVALVESLKGQKDPGIMQLVVVDDCSPAPFPDTDGVTVVRRTVNGGFGSAVNSGAAAAEHPLLLILNSDLEIGPTFISDLLSAAAPWQPAVASPQVLGHNGAPQWVGRHFPTVRHQVTEWLTPLARWRHLRLLHDMVGHDTRCRDGAVVPVNWVMGAAMLVPTSEFRAVGGFDEGFFMNSEEVDLQRRLRERGVPSVFLGTVSVTHEGGGSSDSTRRRQWLVDSRKLYAEKWGSPRTLQASLAAATMVNLAVNMMRRLAGTPVKPLEVARTELELLRGRQPKRPNVDEALL